MTLTPCRECGKDVSTEAAACPHCGAAAPTRQRSDDWVPCPKCGSANTRKIGPGLMGCASFITGSCLLWIPVIGWVMAPIAFLLALFLWLSALIPSGRISFQCQACKQWFTVRKDELPSGGSAAATAKHSGPEVGETYIHREGSVRKADEVFRAWTSTEFARMEKAADLPTNPIDRHFLLLQICEQAYQDRTNPEMRSKFLAYARLHLREFPNLAPALKRDFGGTLPRVPTFQNLATVLTEDGAFDEAVAVCEAALAHGLHDKTVSGFEGRIARIRRKQEKASKLPGPE